MSLLTLLNDELILKVCVYANSPRTLTDPPGGYAAAQALSATCLAMSLVSTIYADRCETEELEAFGPPPDDELLALARALQRPIVVYSRDAAPLRMGDGNGEELVVTYHRDYYALGEHYNSTEPLRP